MGYNLVTITAPSEAITEPLTLDEVKTHLALDHDEQDVALPGMITAARVAAEEYTGLALANRAMRYSSDVAPVGNQPILVPRFPVVTLDDFKHYDSDGTPTSIDVAELRFESWSLPTKVWYNQAWPTMAAWALDFTCGYDYCNAPAGIKRALLVHCGWQFSNRGDAEEKPIPLGFYSLLDQYSTGEEFVQYP